MNEVLTAAEPLPVLFCHKCSGAAHALHAELKSFFAQKGMVLQCDPFKVAEDLAVKMKRLQIHGVAFHCTIESLSSKPCKLELNTARRLDVPIVVLSDGTRPPAVLNKRLYLRLSGLSGDAEKRFVELADEMGVRTRVHAVLQWLCEPGRTVEERENGCMWLCDQPQQVLAEFLMAIAGLHQGQKEDAIICRLLATVLARTGLPDALSFLRKWLLVSKHPNAIFGIEKAIEKLGSHKPPAKQNISSRGQWNQQQTTL